MPEWNFIKNLMKESEKKPDNGSTSSSTRSTKEEIEDRDKGGNNNPVGSDSTKQASSNVASTNNNITTATNNNYYQRGIGFASDVGMVRSTDEDSIVILDLMTAFESKRKRKVVLILADGMGGHNKGEIASKIASSTLAYELHRYLGDGDDIDEEQYHAILSKAISVANRQILRYSEVHSEAEGMGTTVSMAVVDESQNVHIANVGDSRVYIINREEGAVQRTKDHTLVQQLVDEGRISYEEARNHPKKNILNRAVGIFEDLEVDTCSMRLSDDDFVLVCCDGLTNQVSDDEIAKIVMDNTNPQQACDELIALANKRGGKDNISLIIAPAGIMKV